MPTLAERMDAIQDDVTAAAQTAAATARELAQLAHALLPKVSADDPMDTQDILQGIAVLSKMANEASAAGRALLAQQRTSRQRPPAEPPAEPAATDGFEELNKAVNGLVANLSERRGRRKSG